jgi:hypothetical protein
MIHRKFLRNTTINAKYPILGKIEMQQKRTVMGASIPEKIANTDLKQFAKLEIESTPFAGVLSISLVPSIKAL